MGDPAAIVAAGTLASAEDPGPVSCFRWPFAGFGGEARPFIRFVSFASLIPRNPSHLISPPGHNLLPARVRGNVFVRCVCVALRLFRRAGGE